MDDSPYQSPRIVIVLLAAAALAGAGCGGSSASPEPSQAQRSADDAFRAKFEATKDGKAALRAMRESLRYPDGKPPVPAKGKANRLRKRSTP